MKKRFMQNILYDLDKNKSTTKFSCICPVHVSVLKHAK